MKQPGELHVLVPRLAAANSVPHRLTGGTRATLTLFVRRTVNRRPRPRNAAAQPLASVHLQEVAPPGTEIALTLWMRP